MRRKGKPRDQWNRWRRQAKTERWVLQGSKELERRKEAIKHATRRRSGQGGDTSCRAIEARSIKGCFSSWKWEEKGNGERDEKDNAPREEGCRECHSRSIRRAMKVAYHAMQSFVFVRPPLLGGLGSSSESTRSRKDITWSEIEEKCPT